MELEAVIVLSQSLETMRNRMGKVLGVWDNHDGEVDFEGCVK